MNKGWLGGFVSSEIKSEDINLKDGGTMKKARFSIACRRKTKDNNSDFIYVTALGKVAEGIINFFEKGKGIIVEYHIQTGSYTDKEGKKIFTEDKLVDSWEFPPVRKADADSQNDNTYTGTQQTTQAVGQPMPQEQETEFMKIPDQAILDSLPFR